MEKISKTGLSGDFKSIPGSGSERSFLVLLKTTGIAVISAICFLLLFIGGPDYFSGRLFTQVWGLGHIVAFSIWTYAIISYWEKISGQPYPKQFVTVISIALFVGVLTECVQIKFNRTPLVIDVFSDLKGCCFSLVFLAPARKTISQKRLFILQIITVAIVLLEVYPVTLTVADEIISKFQFPVIAGFETPFETSRLSSPEYERDGSVSKNGNYSLKVPLTKDVYSGVGFKHFPCNWKSYNYFHISIYQPSSDHIRASLKIYDLIHLKTGREYSDRYQKTIILNQGWNDIQVPLSEVEEAPSKRKMDLTNIREIGLHAIGLPGKDVIYIDDVCLAR